MCERIPRLVVSGLVLIACNISVVTYGLSSDSFFDNDGLSTLKQLQPLWANESSLRLDTATQEQPKVKKFLCFFGFLKYLNLNL